MEIFSDLDTISFVGNKKQLFTIFTLKCFHISNQMQLRFDPLLR